MTANKSVDSPHSIVPKSKSSYVSSERIVSHITFKSKAIIFTCKDILVRHDRELFYYETSNAAARDYMPEKKRILLFSPQRTVFW